MFFAWLLHIINFFHIFLVPSITDIQKSWVRLRDIMKLNLIKINFYCLFAFLFPNAFLLRFQLLLFNHTSNCKSIFKLKHQSGFLTIHHTIFLTASSTHLRALSYLIFSCVLWEVFKTATSFENSEFPTLHFLTCCKRDKFGQSWVKRRKG